MKNLSLIALAILGTASLPGLVTAHELKIFANRLFVPEERGRVTIFLAETAVDDAGLGHLAGLPNLQALELDHTRVTDAGLASIARLSALRRLELHDNPGITDAAIVHLRGLSRLQSLDLWKTRVTRAGARNPRVPCPRRESHTEPRSSG